MMDRSHSVKRHLPFLPLYTVLHSHGCFPSSCVDAEFLLDLHVAEGDRYQSDPENFLPSEIGRLLVNAVRKKQSQCAVAGLVAVCYIYLNKNGVKPSLEKASKLASEIGYISGKGKVIGEDDESVVSEFSMNSDLAGVKKIFRKYRSVSHIWATSICRHGIYDIAPQDCSVQSSYSASLLYIQKELESSTDTSSWKLLNLREVIDGSEIQDSSWGWGSAPNSLISIAFMKLRNGGGSLGVPRLLGVTRF